MIFAPLKDTEVKFFGNRVLTTLSNKNFISVPAPTTSCLFSNFSLNPTVLYNPTTGETKPNAPSNAVSGNGMIIGSTAVYNLEQFWGKKIKVTGTRYMGNPMLLKDAILPNDNWENIPVIAIEKIELAE